jgi:hypothetical protein
MKRLKRCSKAIAFCAFGFLLIPTFMSALKSRTPKNTRLPQPHNARPVKLSEKEMGEIFGGDIAPPPPLSGNPPQQTSTNWKDVCDGSGVEGWACFCEAMVLVYGYGWYSIPHIFKTAH